MAAPCTSTLCILLYLPKPTVYIQFAVQEIGFTHAQNHIKTIIAIFSTCNIFQYTNTQIVHVMPLYVPSRCCTQCHALTRVSGCFSWIREDTESFLPSPVGTRKSFIFLTSQQLVFDSSLCQKLQEEECVILSI